MTIRHAWALLTLSLLIAGCTMSSGGPTPEPPSTPSTAESQPAPETEPVAKANEAPKESEPAPETPAETPVEAPTTGPYTLVLSGKTGQGYSLTLNQTTEAKLLTQASETDDPEVAAQLNRPSTLNLQAKVDFRITKATAEGTTWTERNRSFSAKGTGLLAAHADDMNAEERGRTVNRTRDARNRITDDPNAEDNVPLIFPEGPVSVGDTWEASCVLSGQPTNVQFALRQVQQVKSKTVLLIEATATGNVSTPEPIRLWIDPDTGWLIQAVGTLIAKNDQGVESKTTFRWTNPNRPIP